MRWPSLTVVALCCLSRVYFIHQQKLQSKTCSQFNVFVSLWSLQYKVLNSRYLRSERAGCWSLSLYCVEVQPVARSLKSGWFGVARQSNSPSVIVWVCDRGRCWVHGKALQGEKHHLTLSSSVCFHKAIMAVVVRGGWRWLRSQAVSLQRLFGFTSSSVDLCWASYSGSVINVFLLLEVALDKSMTHFYHFYF